MLLLDSRCATIDGVTVGPDHADSLQWYYQPTVPHLTVLDGTPSFQLLGFRGSRQGGLLSFDCNVGLSDPQLASLKQKIRSQFDLDGDPRLAPVPLVDGTVHFIVLDTDTSHPGAGTGDGAAAAPVPGPFVVKAMHNAKPSLYGENQAAFSAILDEAGYALVRGTLDSTILPVAVVYSLDYLALRPAYKVTLSIDWDRVQKHLDETFGAKLWVFSSEISRVVDELDESKAIDLRADTFVEEGTDGVIDRRDAALAQVKAMITTAFFEPSLPPWTPEKPSDWEKALKALGDFAAQQAVWAAGGPKPVDVTFSYKKTDYTRIDRKHLDVDFSERTTVRRSVYPQAHLESLASAIAASPDLLSRLVREIDVDLEFFRRRRLQVLYRPNLGAPLIDSIDVHATYGGVPRNALLVPDAWSANFEWHSDVHGDVVDRDVALRYDVRFKDADTTERPVHLPGPSTTSSDDVTTVLPEADVFTIRSVTVLAERIPWDRFDSAEVHLRYRDDVHGIDQQDMFRLKEGGTAAVWPMFVVDREHTAYEVRTVLRALDGNDIDSGWAPGDDEQVSVRNPYRPHALAVVPNLSWDEIRDVFVDVRYADPAHDVLVEDTLHLSKGSELPTFVVDLRDPNRTGIEYTVTFSYLDGRVRQLPPSITFDRRLILNPDMRGHRVIEVQAPAAWVARSVEHVTVHLRFEDFMANLTYAGTVDLDGPAAHGRFEFDYVDATRNRYEWRTHVLFANGLTQDTDWTASADAVVVPRLP